MRACLRTAFANIYKRDPHLKSEIPNICYSQGTELCFVQFFEVLYGENASIDQFDSALYYIRMMYQQSKAMGGRVGHIMHVFWYLSAVQDPLHVLYKPIMLLKCFQDRINFEATLQIWQVQCHLG